MTKVCPDEPLSKRFCEHCLTLGEQHVEDEQHFVLECPCYQEIRQRFTDVLNFNTDVHTLFTANDQVELVDLSTDALMQNMTVTPY